MKTPKKIPIDEPITLNQLGDIPESVHVFDEDSKNAIIAAWAARRPLLVQGEPGTGKSQLARAIAQHWERLFVSVVVNSRTESADLHWHFDAVARLAEAQACSGIDKALIKQALNPHKYLSPGPLWWVFDWQNASDHYQDQCEHKRGKPTPPKDWRPEQGAVILIDEIDKAETDLPNDLLGTLGDGCFQVPWLDNPITMNKQEPPLVIITTNEERELPAAFVRRCLVLNLELPRDRDALLDQLCARGKAHFGDKTTEAVRIKAAEQLIDDRQRAKQAAVHPPGQAEYLDLLRALCEITDHSLASDKEKQQLEQLELIHKFVYQKSRDLHH